MGTLTREECGAVEEAIIEWTGYGVEAYPQREDARVEARFGKERAAELMSLVRRLDDDFYKSNASDIAADVAEMEQMALADFRRLHPELSSRAAKALAWCYTFDFK